MNDTDREDGPIRRDTAQHGTVLAYPAASLIGDGLRIGFGLVVAAVFLLIVPVGNGVWWFLVSILTLSLIVLTRTMIRLCTRLRMDSAGVAVWLALPGGRTVPLASMAWADMDVFKVRNYADRTFKAPYWVQITLKGKGGPGRLPIKADQRLAGFQELLETAWDHALKNRLVLDRTTQANLTALSIHGHLTRPDAPTDREGSPP
ncbi:MAG: hypothetical protein ACFB6R_00930 [Alphaproteobacteria bacterium]